MKIQAEDFFLRTEHFDRRCACNPTAEISVWGNVWVTKIAASWAIYRVIKKSVCTWRLYCYHQVHRDFFDHPVYSTLFQKPTLVREMSLVTLPHHYFVYPPCYYYW